MFITAQRIHDGHRWLPENSILEVDEHGYILSITQGKTAGNVVFYEGVLAPGFVNAHCHLELSHMKGFIPEHTGLIPFLQQVPTYRNQFTDEQKINARNAAYEELVANGIVAVGDITNTPDTLDLRAKDKLHMHSFIEALGFNNKPEKLYDNTVQAYRYFEAQPIKEKILRQSMVPHAPYSVSRQFFELIDKHSPEALLSIHNQESWAENQFYLSKEGPVNDLLQGFNIDYSFFQPSGKTSLQTYVEWLSHTHPVIFIHNTFTDREDIQAAHAYLPEVFWCLCPNANLYIEETLPQVELFIEEQADICIGTDSLASNHQLCILSELVTIKEHFPKLDWEQLLRWATWNGARALQMDHLIGSIAPGKQPGIIQITGLGTTGKPRVKRIV